MKNKQTFSIGQRWISTSEPELGIGSIISCDNRFVEITYPAHQSQRKYASADAPLKRILFTVGETVKDKKGRNFIVTSVQHNDETGLVTYVSESTIIFETELSDTINISTPDKRFLAGIADSNDDFLLRCSMAHYRSVINGSEVRGFTGGRIDLLPHQMYIAETVANRKIPRALLADETGLGKTIEAALILHRLLLTGRVERVLILVPETLVHQWFVELLRRFNTLCTLVTNEILDDEDTTNIFLEEQMFIADMSRLAKHKLRAAQVLDVSWDMVIIDEVHHVKKGSDESLLLGTLAQQQCGLLLLSATPEQFGAKNHFARLQLLDPDRFRNWEEYSTEKETMQEISKFVDSFIETNNIDIANVSPNALQLPLPEVVKKKMALQDSGEKIAGKPATISLTELIDLYALGRVQFRNTRRMVKGFPVRVVNSVPLPGLSDQIKKIASDAAQCHAAGAGTLPLTIIPDDPRIPWLAQLNKDLQRKVLILCGKKETAIVLQSELQQLIRIDIALFHEDMTLIQRDRNAAWFEEENGAQILISSESGSEGRNFQFCSHLVLFDLPWNPELLEQRIGRLDRIGQASQITIHVPYILQSAHEMLFKWYHYGVDSLVSNIPAAGEVFEELETELFTCSTMDSSSVEFSNAVDSLIEKTRVRCACLSETLFNRRDRLLELSSYRPSEAKQTIDAIKKHDLDGIAANITHTLFKHYGIVVEEAGPERFLMNTDYLTDHAFPLPRIERPMITFDRAFARTREDVEFLTIDHPMITGALELYLSSDHGISSFALWRDEKVKELVVECLFILECVAPPHLFTDRFLSSLPIRSVVNHLGSDVTDRYQSVVCQQHCESGPVTKLLAAKSIADVFSKMVRKSTEIVNEKSKAYIQAAVRVADDFYTSESVRLDHLQKQGAPMVAKELHVLLSEKDEVRNCLLNSRIRLECLRVIRRGPVSAE